MDKKISFARLKNVLHRHPHLRTNRQSPNWYDVDSPKFSPREPDDLCPQCGDPKIYPRGLEPYCENCGWPDENRGDSHNEEGEGE